MRNIKNYSKADLLKYAKSLGIATKGKKKLDLVSDIESFKDNEIIKAINEGGEKELLISKIENLAKEYATNLNTKIINRKKEMKLDDNSYYLIYRVLGITIREGKLIDEYQNTGRFLYKYAGSFLEEATSLCLKFNNFKGGKSFVNNSSGKKPKKFEIDFLDNNNAIEIKWRDATTDGDHIIKEHSRVRAIKKHGYTPIRVMFYYPQREQAKKVQSALKAIYKGLDGEYYSGEDAWSFIEDYTGFNLKSMLVNIANERMPKNGHK